MVGSTQTELAQCLLLWITENENASCVIEVHHCTPSLQSLSRMTCEACRRCLTLMKLNSSGGCFGGKQMLTLTSTNGAFLLGTMPQESVPRVGWV